MKLLELLDAGPSAHTTLSRFAKELEAKGFEAEVKSSSKPGIVNRSKLCIVVKGYGLKDVIKLYKPLFKWEDGGTWFVDSKHEQKFRTVPEMVAVLKDRYARLSKCMQFVPPEVKESAGHPTIRSRVLRMQQALISHYDEVSKLIRVKAQTSDGADYDRFVFIADPVSKDDPHYEHYKRAVIVIDDIASVNKTSEPGASVRVYGTEKPYDWLLDQDWSGWPLNRMNVALQFSDEDVITGRPESIENAIAELTK